VSDPLHALITESQGDRRLGGAQSQYRHSRGQKSSCYCHKSNLGRLTCIVENSLMHIPLYLKGLSQDNSVGIATDYGLDDWMIRVGILAGAGNFSLRYCVQTGLGPTQPPIHWIPGALSLGVKRPGHEADR
jgi:hypothetical protein